MIDFCTKGVVLKLILIFLAIVFSVPILAGCQSTPQQEPMPTVSQPDKSSEAEEEPSSMPEREVSESNSENDANFSAFPAGLLADDWQIQELQPDIPELSPADSALLSVTRFYQDDRYVDRINLTSEILFDFDSDQLTSNAKRVTGLVVRNFIKQLQSQNVYVVGHTDSDGPEEYNLDLSLRRAESVLQVLREHDVPTDNLSLLPAGEYIPLVSNTSISNKALTGIVTMKSMSVEKT